MISLGKTGAAAIALFAALLFAQPAFAAPPVAVGAQAICTVTINKTTVPPGGTAFNFSSAWNGLQGITLNGGQSITRSVGCGPIFNLYEVAKPGWTLTGITCSVSGGTGHFGFIGANANPAFQPGDNEVRFDSLTPGSNLICTFTNTGPPPGCTVTINKTTVPPGGTAFNFSSAWSGLQGITLNGGQSITRSVGCGPIFNFYEVAKPGWTLTGITCSVSGGTGHFGFIGANANPAFQPGDNEVRFDSLTPGSNLICTFTNTGPPPGCTVTINKTTVPPGGTAFNFSSAWNGLQGITLNGGQSVTRSVGCGPIFNVYEVAKPGWTLTGITCSVSGGTGNFGIIGANANPAFQPGDNEVRFDSLTPGSNLICTFTNTGPPPGCTVTINKTTVPPGGTAFNFSSAWNGLQGITLNGGQSVTRSVGCGPIFNVYEVAKPGWTLTGITCSVSGGTGNFGIIGANANPAFQPGDNEVRFDSLTPGSNLICTFKNHNP